MLRLALQRSRKKRTDAIQILIKVEFIQDKRTIAKRLDLRIGQSDIKTEDVPLPVRNNQAMERILTG